MILPRRRRSEREGICGGAGPGEGDPGGETGADGPYLGSMDLRLWRERGEGQPRLQAGTVQAVRKTLQT